ncbi:MAG: M14 family zinc carboxypeptidase [Armatimonadota bacterium]
MPKADLDLDVSTDFEGANPQTAAGVTREGESSFLIVPTQEEHNPNYKFRMDTLIVNRSSRQRRVALRVDWRDPTYMEPRHHLFFRSKEIWKRVQGQVRGTIVTVKASVPPGNTWVSLNPKYSYSDHLADLEHWRTRPGVQVRSIGKTGGGRDIYVISVGPAAGSPSGGVLVEAGNHPYETSGAYCIDGMLRWLQEAGKSWRERVTSHFIQLSNPDGVAGGWCRLTGPGGVDTCHEFGISPDPTCAAIRSFVQQLRPTVYVNIHGWMYNDLDNFRYENEEAARFFLPALLGKVGGPVWRWRIQNSRPEEPPITNTWWIREHLRARTLGFDIAWNRRTDRQMRDLGAALLAAALEADHVLPPL